MLFSLHPFKEKKMLNELSSRTRVKWKMYYWLEKIDRKTKVHLILSFVFFKSKHCSDQRVEDRTRRQLKTSKKTRQKEVFLWLYPHLSGMLSANRFGKNKNFLWNECQTTSVSNFMKRKELKVFLKTKSRYGKVKQFRSVIVSWEPSFQWKYLWGRSRFPKILESSVWIRFAFK